MPRGGPQVIPRPEGARPGEQAPWAGLAPEQRVVTLAGVEVAMVGHEPRPAKKAPLGAGESAVLCLVYEHEGEVEVVLTRRSPTLRHHAHEVSFPGGRREPGDTDLWETALRESEEEVGLDRSLVRRIGALDSFVTVGSNASVTPFVGVCERRPVLVPSPAEVESILLVPLSELLLEEVWREEIWPIGADGDDRAMSFFELVGDTVWGATGSMLRQLLAIATDTDG